MLPTVTFDDPSGTYTFTLWRDDKEVTHELKGLSVYLEVIPEQEDCLSKEEVREVFLAAYSDHISFTNVRVKLDSF